MPVNREYKDRLFTFIFGNEEHREWTLSLYNAINGSHYTNAADIQLTTIKNVLYLGMHNDVSFIIANQMNLYEQQSSFNPNMPLRMLQYAGNLFEQYLDKNALWKYGEELIWLPVPKFVVFYNGLKILPDETIMRLSDAFPKEAKADIEVWVRMLNINYEHNRVLMDACKPLGEYAWIVEQIRERQKTASLEDAVNSTIRDMSVQNLLFPLLSQHQKEVCGMLLTEYDEAKTLQLAKDFAYKKGKEEGKEEGWKEGRKEGGYEKIISLYHRNKLSVQDCAEELGISEAEFLEIAAKQTS